MASFSKGLVLTTTMLVSSTLLYLVFSRQKIISPFQIHGSHDSQDSNRQILRSCLYSEEKKMERRMTTKKKKKKKVQFADSAKEASETRKEKQGKQNRVPKNCRHEIPKIRGIPTNRVALYNGILRDRLLRMECSY